MKLVAKGNENERFYSPYEIILGESADYYISFDVNTHTFYTHEKAYWDVEEDGWKPGEKSYTIYK